MTKQEQAGGDNSTNIQAAGDVHIGLTYTEARQVALDVFDSNFFRLSEVAAATAKARAEELTDAFLKKMKEGGAPSVGEAKNPDFQYAFFTAQREFARSGDENLGNLLVQLLVDRTKEEKRSLLQIVLNESLAVAPRLTPDQLDALTLVFVLRYTRYQAWSDLNSFLKYLTVYVGPFVGHLTKKASAYQHLEFASCGTIGLGEISIPEIWLRNYSAFFSKGFSSSDIESSSLTVEHLRPILIRCFHQPALLQFAGVDEDTIGELGQKQGLTTDEIARAKSLHTSKLMSSAEVKAFVIKAVPVLAQLFETWDGSYMKNLTLTSVGIAIGHANLQRRTGEAFNLSIWI